MKKVYKLFLFICLISLIFCSCSELVDNTTDKTGGSVIGGALTGGSTILPHTISFEENGGTEVKAKTVTKLEKAPTTTKDGYIFDGWFLDENLITPVVYPLNIDDNMTVYAKWVKKSYTVKYEKSKIKFMDDSYNPSATYNITPTGFDYDRLEDLGANGINVTVEYKVKYVKDYDVLWDIGYAGSPKYELTIINSSGRGKFLSDLTTSTAVSERTATLCTTFNYFEEGMLTLSFSTDNIQNIIYISDIVVTYECVNVTG